MHFDKAEIPGRIACQPRYVIDVESCMAHGFPHGDAVGVFLVKPAGIKLTHQCTGAQKSGFVALTFFLGKSHHLKVKGEPLAQALEFAHAGHGHKNTQATVVFAAVSNGVVMRAGQQSFGGWFAGKVAPHHIANRVNAYVVKAALQHLDLDLGGARPVGVRQISYRELPFFGITRIGVRCQCLMPVPHQIADDRFDAEFVIQPDFDDAMNVAQALLQLEAGMPMQATLKRVDDLLFAQPGTPCTPHSQNEREAEFCVVVGIELLDSGELFRCAIGQADLALLMG